MCLCVRAIFGWKSRALVSQKPKFSIRCHAISDLIIGLGHCKKFIDSFDATQWNWIEGNGFITWLAIANWWVPVAKPSYDFLELFRMDFCTVTYSDARKIFSRNCCVFQECKNVKYFSQDLDFSQQSHVLDSKRKELTRKKLQYKIFLIISINFNIPFAKHCKIERLKVRNSTMFPF